MSVITFPEALAEATVSSLSWAQQRRDLAFSSAFGSQGVEVSQPVWSVSLGSTAMLEKNAGEWQALLMKLRGQTNQLELWNIGRPEPRGTMRGTMTLNADAAAGAVTLQIVAAGEVAKTLVPGDMLGIGSGTTQQLVMVTAEATSDGSGIISVSIEPPLRNNHVMTAPVTWSKPKALFRRKQTEARWDYANIAVGGFSLDLIEDVRP